MGLQTFQNACILMCVIKKGIILKAKKKHSEKICVNSERIEERFFENTSNSHGGICSRKEFISIGNYTGSIL